MIPPERNAHSRNAAIIIRGSRIPSSHHSTAIVPASTAGADATRVSPFRIARTAESYIMKV
jgi:hypothetical protein